MKILFAALSLTALGAGSATAADTPFCANLKKVIASAAEAKSYASVEGKKADEYSSAGKIALIAGGSCSISRISGMRDHYACVTKPMTPAAAAPIALKLHADVAACLGNAGREPGMTESYGGEDERWYATTSSTPPVAVIVATRGYDEQTLHLTVNRTYPKR